MSKDRTPACNTDLEKVAVQCSADTFVVNQSLGHRRNICCENNRGIICTLVDGYSGLK
ncbi:MAG: hypothetical protein ACOYN9_16020 [Saprospiraceae bacterium]